MADRDLRQSRAHVLEQLLGMSEDERGDVLAQLPRAELLAIALEGLELHDAFDQLLAVRPDALPGRGHRTVILDRHEDGRQVATVCGFSPYDEASRLWPTCGASAGCHAGA